jgi:hypothetical protein
MVTIGNYPKSTQRQSRMARDDFEMGMGRGKYELDDSEILETEGRGTHKKRLSSLKKEALKGLQDIQHIISGTYHFGAQVDELERLSEDARNAYDDGDYQEVLLYVDKSDELSRRLKVAYIDSIISDIKYSGENTEYLEYLLSEIETSYNDEKYKIGDELCRRFMNVINDIKNESKTPKRGRMYCRYCGSTLPQDSSFCSSCGERII